jgi:hypothetical protein
MCVHSINETQQKASTADLIKQNEPVSLKTQKENKVKVKLFDSAQPEEKKEKRIKSNTERLQATWLKIKKANIQVIRV